MSKRRPLRPSRRKHWNGPPVAAVRRVELKLGHRQRRQQAQVNQDPEVAGDRERQGAIPRK
jgi:hypothetical protein